MIRIVLLLSIVLIVLDQRKYDAHDHYRIGIVDLCTRQEDICFVLYIFSPD